MRGPAQLQVGLRRGGRRSAHRDQIDSRMEIVDGTPTTRAKSRFEWRRWLRIHGETEQRIWLIIFHKASPVPSVHFEEAIEEALCFGWIDSKGRRRGEDSFYLCFSRRNPKSSWGKKSRERATRLMESGLMTRRGQAVIDLAKSMGTWDAHIEAQNDVVPAELMVLLEGDPVARENFDGFPPSSRRIALEWISKAKRPETRQKRILQTAALARENLVAGLPTGMNIGRRRKG
jgi:uncharacterized protein YdeI (YjbR/CyaY-like superfamily)